MIESFSHKSQFSITTSICIILHSIEFKYLYLHISDSIVGIRDNNLECKKLETFAPADTPKIVLTNSENCDSLVIDSAKADPSGMLNLISNDLDYLLNRTHEVPALPLQYQLPPAPPPPASFTQGAKSNNLSNSLHQQVIIEESECEQDS